VMKKVQRGLDAADQRGVLSQDEVERRLDPWTSK
jgi:hypothetical protein